MSTGNSGGRGCVRQGSMRFRGFGVFRTCHGVHCWGSLWGALIPTRVSDTSGGGGSDARGSSSAKQQEEELQPQSGTHALGPQVLRRDIKNLKDHPEPGCSRCQWQVWAPVLHHQYSAGTMLQARATRRLNGTGAQARQPPSPPLFSATNI